MRRGAEAAVDEHDIDWIAVLWFAGWLVAVVSLFCVGVRLPLQTRHDGWRGVLYGVAVIAAGIGIAVLANLAAVLHDTHLDFTREQDAGEKALAEFFVGRSNTGHFDDIGADAQDHGCSPG